MNCDMGAQCKQTIQVSQAMNGDRNIQQRKGCRSTNTRILSFLHSCHREGQSQQSELISPLLQPHLQQALDSPTTTSRPFLSTERKASSTSSDMRERAGLLNTSPSCSPCASDGRLESDACWEDVAAPYSTEVTAALLSFEFKRSSISSVQHKRC